jgi:hypothetical protein
MWKGGRRGKFDVGWVVEGLIDGDWKKSRMDRLKIDTFKGCKNWFEQM